MPHTVFTIGHSTHPAERLLELLRQHGITALGDVRSTPFSRFNPQFNKRRLEESLPAAGIRYVFLGRELGARSDDDSCYDHGKVQYDRLARTALFQQGLGRVLDGLDKGFRLALMCAEKDPLECHRGILIARHLEDAGCEVRHILATGALESHADALARLARQLGLETDMFSSHDDVVAEAYRLQADRIGYVRK